MEKVAIIGTGIAGMSAAWLLNSHYDITVFEQNDYVGGHTNTVEVEEAGQKIPVDTGFIVFNKTNYPHLVRLFEKLEVPYKPSTMSFSVQNIPGNLEFNGSGINGIFGQRRNLFRPSFYRMLSEIMRFNKESILTLDDPIYKNYTISDYIEEKQYSRQFLETYLLPMNSAIWSTPPETSLEFPFVTLVRFFKNHGLLGVNTHFQWFTVDGGSRTYRDKLIAPFRQKIKTNARVIEILESDKGVAVKTSDAKMHYFDKVLVATHADQALAMLKKPTVEQFRLLSPFAYQKNNVTLHNDASVMPRRRRLWSAWNYRLEGKNGSWITSTVYNMNILQNLPAKKDYLLSVNDPGNIDLKKIIRQIRYDHPVFNLAAIKAQEELPTLNDEGKIYFCGSYFGYGFHEDALKSGIAAAEKLSGKNLWS